MGIKQYRVDNRMLHGQVITAYGRSYGIDEYIVVNEEISKNDLQISLLEMAAMMAKVRVVSPKELVEIVKTNDLKGTSTLVVFKEIEDAVESAENGLTMEALQIGGMFSREGRDRKKYDVALFADEQDKSAFRKLEDMNIDLSFQVVPDYRAKKLSSLIKY